MEKIRKSTLAKIIAGIGFIVSFAGLFGFGALCAMFALNDGYGPDGVEAIKTGIVRDITRNYVREAIDAYYSPLMSGNDANVNYYEDYFSQEKCNASFTITPSGVNTGEYEPYTNYELKDASKYKFEEMHSVQLDSIQKTIRLNITQDEVYRRLSEANGVRIAYCLQNGKVIIYDNGELYRTIDTKTEDNKIEREKSEEVNNTTEAIANVVENDDVDETTTEVDVDDEVSEATTEVAVYDEPEEVTDTESYPDDIEYLDEEEIDDVTEVQVDDVSYEGEPDYNWEDGLIYDSATNQYIDVDYTFDFNPNSGETIFLNESADNLYIYPVYHDELRYYLNKDIEFTKKHKQVLDEVPESAYLDIITTYYDPAAQQAVIVYTFENIMTVNVRATVNEKFPANDEYHKSLELHYIDDIYNATIPGLIISAVVALICGLFICLSAGHVKTSEEVTMNPFDRFPLDILMLVMFVPFVMLVGAMDMRGNDEAVLMAIAALGCIGIMSPFMLATVSTRFKVGRLFKNTVIWFVCAGIFKLCKITYKFVRDNFNICWKAALLFVVGAAVDFAILVMGCVGAGALAVFLFLIVKYIALIIFVVIVVNLYQLRKAGNELASGNSAYEVKTKAMFWEFKKHGENLNNIGEGIQLAVDESMKSERMKTELITNVSHDIKTPLTSIINYVDLLEKEDIQNEKALEYIEVLDRQSARLKKLIEDLLEASKASTGNINVELSSIDVAVITEQLVGEFEDKLSARGLKPIVNIQDNTNTNVIADGRLLYRTMDNLMVNICKYAQENSRVYIDIKDGGKKLFGDGKSAHVKKQMLEITFKNISKDELNISGDELIERFVRGDSSRNTEGSGLGLSIAKSLMNVQQGDMKIAVDGDLFKVTLEIPMAEQKERTVAQTQDVIVDDNRDIEK